MPLGQRAPGGAADGVEEPGGEREPGAHRRAAVGPELLHRLVRLEARVASMTTMPGTRAHGRVGEVGLVRPGDDREPGPVGDLVERRVGGLLGRLEPRAPHRAGGVDDDDLARVAGAGPARGTRAVQVTVTIALTSVPPSGRNSFW